jgi:ubiquinone/menaquinone biosynthesis C-methylase UbiE
MEVLREKLSSLSGGRVLDVGTGRGYFIHTLTECFKDYDEMIGVDNCSDEKLQPARENFKDDSKVKFISMDAESLDFEDESFDTVCISNTLHHLADSTKVLNEMVRVLKPGGMLIVNEMYKDNQTDAQLTHVYMHHWWGEIDTASGVVHKETYTKQEITDIIKPLGLTEIEIVDHSNLDEDCKSDDTLKEIEQIINNCIERSKPLPNADTLIAKGDELRKRLNEFGWHNATQAIIICKK